MASETRGSISYKYNGNATSQDNRMLANDIAKELKTILGKDASIAMQMQKGGASFNFPYEKNLVPAIQQAVKDALDARNSNTNNAFSFTNTAKNGDVVRKQMYEKIDININDATANKNTRDYLISQGISFSRPDKNTISASIPFAISAQKSRDDFAAYLRNLQVSGTATLSNGNPFALTDPNDINQMRLNTSLKNISKKFTRAKDIRESLTSGDLSGQWSEYYNNIVAAKQAQKQKERQAMLDWANAPENYNTPEAKRIRERAKKDDGETGAMIRNKIFAVLSTSVYMIYKTLKSILKFTQVLPDIAANVRGSGMAAASYNVSEEKMSQYNAWGEALGFGKDGGSNFTNAMGVLREAFGNKTQLDQGKLEMLAPFFSQTGGFDSAIQYITNNIDSPEKVMSKFLNDALTLTFAGKNEIGEQVGVEAAFSRNASLLGKALGPGFEKIFTQMFYRIQKMNYDEREKVLNSENGPAGEILNRFNQTSVVGAAGEPALNNAERNKQELDSIKSMWNVLLKSIGTRIFAGMDRVIKRIENFILNLAEFINGIPGFKGSMNGFLAESYARRANDTFEQVNKMEFTNERINDLLIQTNYRQKYGHDFNADKFIEMYEKGEQYRGMSREDANYLYGLMKAKQLNVAKLSEYYNNQELFDKGNMVFATDETADENYISKMQDRYNYLQDKKEGNNITIQEKAARQRGYQNNTANIYEHAADVNYKAPDIGGSINYKGDFDELSQTAKNIERMMSQQRKNIEEAKNGASVAAISGGVVGGGVVGGVGTTKVKVSAEFSDVIIRNEKGDIIGRSSSKPATSTVRNSGSFPTSGTSSIPSDKNLTSKKESGAVSTPNMPWFRPQDRIN